MVVSTELDPLPFARLANLGLAPRVRGLLEGTFNAAMSELEAALTRALDELGRDLLAHAERGSSPHEQNQCFASVREFRQRRGDFLSAFRNAIQRSLLTLVESESSSEISTLSMSPGERPDPNSADASASDEGLALSQIAARAEIRAATALQALAYRFGVIAGSAPVEIELLPLGPCSLCAAIRSAARRFEVFPLHRVALYRRIDKTLFAEPAVLYDAVNGYLIAHRVYAHLQLLPRVTPAAPTELAPPLAVGSGDALPSTSARSAAAPGIGSSPSEPALEAPPAVVAPGGPVATDLALNAQFFQALREGVSARRHATAGADPGAEVGHAPAARRELQAALKVLQAKAMAPVMVGGNRVNPDVLHIRLDLMNQLRGSSDGGARSLHDDDADTIDLIALLFAQLLKAYRANSVSHAVLCRLQIPVLRIALHDPSFFTGPAHPARRLISAFVESLADWVDDEDSDRQVLDKMQVVADRLAREFDEDPLTFDHCRDELIGHIASLQKKAEIAERRHVEAARGRVKLDLARAAAFEVVRQRLSGSAAPAAVMALLDSAWTDAIALTLLRQGVDHPKSRERIELVDRLLAIYEHPQSASLKHAALDGLRGSLEEGLAAVGFHDDAIVAAWNDLSKLIDASHERAQQAAADAISALIRQKPRLGGDAGPATAGSAGVETWQSAADEALALTQEELDQVERLKQLEVGVWFEFTLSPQGEKVRRRLCWFSTVTGRCLFLNARGARAEDRTLSQLAREILRGRVRQVSSERGDPVERAWRAIMTTLRELRPGATTARSAVYP